jgi:hypothetical protein
MAVVKEGTYGKTNMKNGKANRELGPVHLCSALA